jgi:hypothetical protein
MVPFAKQEGQGLISLVSIYFIIFFSFLLLPTVALPHTAACVGFELGFGGGWRECVVQRIFILFRAIIFKRG